MKLSKTLILLIFIIGAVRAFACPSAHQDRLFPLGICPQGIVFVEMHMQRTQDPKGNEEDMSEKWYGEGFLKIYDKRYKLIRSEKLFELSLNDTIYSEQFIQKNFSEGLARAKKIEGFDMFDPSYFSYCDFQHDCNEVKIKADSVSDNVSIQLKSGKWYPVPVLKDTLSVAGDYLLYYRGFNSGIINYKKLFINSVRKFKAGGKTLTVVHLASGNEDTYHKRNEYAPRFTFNTIEKSVFYEPVLWHGHGFDFFILEE